MKKSAIPVALLLIAAGLSGCPIYDHDEAGCYRDSDCESGYLCDVDTGSCYAEVVGAACRRPSDCENNETCSRSATCMVGDCHFAGVGCVQGYSCADVDGRWGCVDDDLAQGGAPSQGAAGAPADGGEPSAAGGTPSAAAGQAGVAGAN